MALVNKLGFLFLPELGNFLFVFLVGDHDINRVKQKESQIGTETVRKVKKTLSKKKERK